MMSHNDSEEPRKQLSGVEEPLLSSPLNGTKKRRMNPTEENGEQNNADRSSECGNVQPVCASSSQLQAKPAPFSVGHLCRCRISSSSEFDKRTERESADNYFQFYGYLHQQANMLLDYQRTATYQRAIHDNWPDFRDAVVMDVGAGSGILSFFAVQAGASRVYAVEASPNMAEHCKKIVEANAYAREKIRVVGAKVEELNSLPDMPAGEEAGVDVIVSEPMGYMLVNERMLESFMHARKWLRKGGRMFPSNADLHFAFFSDEALYAEQMQRCMFWCQSSFHGVDLRSLGAAALNEAFAQPIVDTWHPDVLVSTGVKWTVDFERDAVERLHHIVVPFELAVTRSCLLHGIASWFDVSFDGALRKIWLSTAPTEPLTHWYQVRCMLREPMMVHQDEKVLGKIEMVANERQSYDILLEVEVGDHRQSNRLDLKAPYFRYTGQPIVPPPGSTGGDQQKLMAQGGYRPDSAHCSHILNRDYGKGNDGDAVTKNFPQQQLLQSHASDPSRPFQPTAATGSNAAGHPQNFPTQPTTNSDELQGKSNGPRD